MSSRLWLAAAFVIAFGAEPTHAEASSDVISVTLDQAKVAKLPPGTSTLIIGNPMIADVTMLKTGDSMVITAKAFGETNVIALSPGRVGNRRKADSVLPAKTTVVLQKGSSRVSYACNPDCMPTGDTLATTTTYLRPAPQKSPCATRWRRGLPPQVRKLPGNKSAAGATFCAPPDGRRAGRARGRWSRRLAIFAVRHRHDRNRAVAHARR